MQYDKYWIKIGHKGSRCFRLAIAPMMLPQEITIATKIKNGTNDSSESIDSTLSKSPSEHNFSIFSSGKERGVLQEQDD
jgi:hypothetical protein